jgi:hypothetical protein
MNGGTHWDMGTEGGPRTSLVVVGSSGEIELEVEQLCYQRRVLGDMETGK